jgi:hypothetical protein
VVLKKCKPKKIVKENPDYIEKKLVDTKDVLDAIYNKKSRIRVGNE